MRLLLLICFVLACSLVLLREDGDPHSPDSVGAGVEVAAEVEDGRSGAIIVGESRVSKDARTRIGEPVVVERTRSDTQSTPDAEANIDPYSVITAENYFQFSTEGGSYEHSRAAAHMLISVAENESIDPSWAGEAISDINHILTNTGINEHASAWSIDCRSTICVVSFDNALSKLRNERETLRQLEESVGQTAVLWRDHAGGRANIFVLREDFVYVRRPIEH